MKDRTPFYRLRSNRCKAAAIALIALVMQGLAAYLPMPAMGGLTSWDLAATCLSSTTQERVPDGGAHGLHCAVCVVLQQAGSTAAPADVILAAPVFSSVIAHDQSRDLKIAHLAARAFSSRAPPFIA